MWRAFWDLNGDRTVGFGGVGPVPFLAIDRYAERFGMIGAEPFEEFFMLIKAMDGELLHASKNSAARRAASDQSAMKTW